MLVHHSNIKIVTAKNDARGGHNTCLDDSVLLSGKWLLQEATIFQEPCPCLHKEKPQEASRDIKGRNNSCCEVQLHHYKAEQYAQYKAHPKGPPCQLISP